MDKKARTTKITEKRPRLMAVTGGQKRQPRPASHSLRGLDQRTVDILVEDKIATGG